MASHQTSNTPNANAVTLNRRSLLKGSVTLAATAVAGTTLGLRSSNAQAEEPKLAAVHALHPWEDFPGGV